MIYICTYDLYGPVRNIFDVGRCGQVGGGWGCLEMESFLRPVKWHRADRRVPFGAQKSSGKGGRGEFDTKREKGDSQV
jgi:hypothetical protein